MKSAQIKNQALAAFLSGKSLREIAADPVMPSKRCLEKWSVAGRWVEERVKARAEARRRVIEDQMPRLVEEEASIEAAKYKLGMMAVAQLVAVVEGRLTEKEMSMSQVKLCRLIDRLTKG